MQLPRRSLESERHADTTHQWRATTRCIASVQPPSDGGSEALNRTGWDREIAVPRDEEQFSQFQVLDIGKHTM